MSEEHLSAGFGEDLFAPLEPPAGVLEALDDDG